MSDARGALLGAEERVERHDAIGLGRRNHEAPTDVVQRTLADPADVALNSMQGWEQKMPARLRGSTSTAYDVLFERLTRLVALGWAE